MDVAAAEISAPGHGGQTGGGHGRCEFTGTVTSVTYPGAAARFSADLALHGPGPGQTQPAGTRIRLVWIGQRTVTGITAGRRLYVRGFLSRRDSRHDGIPTMYNPRYELLPERTP